jgi:hypothetical protein
LADFIGTSVEAAARAVLDCATAKIVPVVEALIKEYGLERNQCLLVGEGGGAASLIPYASERLGLKHEISKDAEVISSIGVALALVRDVVERIIPHPQPEDLQAIRREALDAVVRLGADARGVDVTVEVDRQTHRVRAIAMGAAALRVTDPGGAIYEREARAIAARSMGLASTDTLRLAGETAHLRVYQAPHEGMAGAVRAVDREGAIRVQRSTGAVAATTPGAVAAAIEEFWLQAAGQHGKSGVPGLFLLYESHVIDLSGVESLEQALALAASEIDALAADASVIVVGVPPDAAPPEANRPDDMDP